MKKLTFVLLLSLLCFSAASLFEKQLVRHRTGHVTILRFSPYQEKTVLRLLNSIKLKRAKHPKTIIRIDIPKWKENLCRLLRHRHSTYTTHSVFYAINSKVAELTFQNRVSQTLHISNQIYNKIISPGYYNFLYRLCPF
ncbi:hypothetical protein [Dyadobacter frigoris]|uniref:Uncharacterized protein n=1 Tax=Dyadobacter frigoris TaxID=2576211 RepID=A0A4U6D3D8_9BACT|nr:hypothetical protein [Dyadobacter frigoris]TKT90398.1 hypothetical protein FDK13_21960 [Dyadobacter frigoris]